MKSDRHKPGQADRHNQIYAKVIQTIEDVTGVEQARLNDETELLMDLNLESLGMFEIVIELEETYDLQISDAEIDRIHTIGDIVDFIETALEKKGRL